MRGNVCPTDCNAAVPLDKQCFGDNPVIRKVPAEGCGLLRGDQWVRQDFQYFLIIFSKLGVHYPPPSPAISPGYVSPRFDIPPQLNSLTRGLRDLSLICARV